MNRKLIAVTLFAASTGALAGEVVLFSGENFRGPRLQVETTLPNLARAGFTNQTSSISVRGGTWQVCDGADFTGSCVMLRGDYSNLREVGLPGHVASLREVADRRGESPRDLITDRPRIAFYDRENFGGRGVTVTDIVGDFNDIGFNDRARSVVVYAGTWELCHDMQFRGDCEVLPPGRYAQVTGVLNSEVSSARPVRSSGLEQPPAVGGPSGRVRAVLYEGPRFTGRSLVIDQNVLRNLDGTGFNDRVSSMRIERGYWLFCSDAQFAGECMTFEPGEYPNLPPAIDNRVSSGRRISNDYPYREPPRWGG